LNLLGLLFSIIALVQIQAQPQPQEGRLFALMGLALSAANLLLSLGAVALKLALNPSVINWQAGPF
jgi:NADH:ubiquinone oxidoreductase subunit K